MALRTLDLPSPADLNRRWAALAPIYASRGWGDDVQAAGNLRFWHDGGGSYLAMSLLPHGRALLIGRDRDYSETFIDEEPPFPDIEQPDHFAGAPAWWREEMQRIRLAEGHQSQSVSFVYGWEDGRWRAVAHDLRDGFDRLNPPMLDHEKTVDYIIIFYADLMDDSEPVPRRADVEEMVLAAPDISVEQARRVIPPQYDAEVGALAANKFALPNL